MSNLIIGPGPKLIWRDIHRQDSDHPVDTNVAGRAVEFLYEPVTLDHRLTLGDVFELLNICPRLRQSFRRDFADEFCAEARKGPLPQSRGSDPEEIAGIEVLELYWSWAFDTGSKAYSSVHRLDLHGLGHVLPADAPTYGVKAGQRIIMAQKAEVDAGTAKLIPADQVFGEFDRPGFEALFETLGGVLQGDVGSPLRRIADDEPVGPWLEREFDGKVIAKEPYRQRLGREFRKAFRAAGR